MLVWSDRLVPASEAAGGGVAAGEASVPLADASSSAVPSDARSSDAHVRDFSASLPLASEVASPARLARGAALSAAVAASSAARAENSRTVGLARSARSSTASRSCSRIAVALPPAEAELLERLEPVEPVDPVSVWSARGWARVV